MTEFYITLPSNTKLTGNKNNEFVIELPQKISLQGNWEVGMSDISYPRSWNTISKEVTPNAFVMRKESEESHSDAPLQDVTGNHWGFTVPSGHYNIGPELIGRILSIEKDLLSYDPLSNKVTGIRDDVVYIGKDLRYQLGLDEYPNKRSGTFPVDVTGGLNYLWVYCDLVQPQIVGDTMTNLLATVPIKGGVGMITERFERPQFVPLRTNNFNSIRIQIKDHQDKLFPFQYGSTIIRLCFRRKNVFNR